MGFSSLTKGLPPRQTLMHFYTPRTSRVPGAWQGRESSKQEATAGESSSGSRPAFTGATGNSAEQPLCRRSRFCQVTMGTQSLVPAVPTLCGPGRQKPTRRCWGSPRAAGAVPRSCCLQCRRQRCSHRAGLSPKPARTLWEPPSTHGQGVSRQPLVRPQKETAPNQLTIDRQLPH